MPTFRDLVEQSLPREDEVLSALDDAVKLCRFIQGKALANEFLKLLSASLVREYKTAAWRYIRPSVLR